MIAGYVNRLYVMINGDKIVKLTFVDGETLVTRVVSTIADARAFARAITKACDEAEGKSDVQP